MSDQRPIATRVSIMARLVPVCSYATSMAGAAIGSLLVVRTFQGMRNAETAGITAVANGMSEATQAVAIALYLAIFVGLIGIIITAARAFTTTSTASPSGWFFLISGGIILIPIGLLWQAESLLIRVFSPGFNGGVVQVAAAIQTYLTLTLMTAGALSLILIVASLAPMPSFLRAKSSFAPVLVLGLMELALIGMAVAFQMRSSWLYQVGISERFF